MIEVNCTWVSQSDSMLHISFANDLSVFNNWIRALKKGVFRRSRMDIAECVEVKAFGNLMISKSLIWHLTVRHLNDAEDLCWIMFGWNCHRVESMHFVAELKVDGKHSWGLWLENFSFLMNWRQSLLHKGHHNGLIICEKHCSLRVTNVIDYMGLEAVTSIHLSSFEKSRTNISE